MKGIKGSNQYQRRFKIDTSQIDNLDQEVYDGFRVGMLRAVKMVEAKTKEESPVSPGGGNMRDAVVGDVEERGKKFRGVISIPAKTEEGKPYPLFVTEGTGEFGPKGKPYDIVPKSKKALAFTMGGVPYVRKKVTVRGQKPNPFHERALEAVASRIPDEIESGVKL